MHAVADEDREREIAALVPRTRPPATPRWLWIAALVLGSAGAIAFIVAAVRGGDSSSASSTAPASTGSSFPSGLVLGAAIGLAIGWVLGRRAAQSSAHSERSRP
jgi:drug/metabolite transporter (DMT)-like permease